MDPPPLPPQATLAVSLTKHNFAFTCLLLFAPVTLHAPACHFIMEWLTVTQQTRSRCTFVFYRLIIPMLVLETVFELPCLIINCGFSLSSNIVSRHSQQTKAMLFTEAQRQPWRKHCLNCLLADALIIVYVYSCSFHLCLFFLFFCLVHFVLTCARLLCSP